MLELEFEDRRRLCRVLGLAARRTPKLGRNRKVKGFAIREKLG